MPDRSTPGDHDHAISGLLTELSDAWNAGDADAYGRPFTEDARYVTYFGHVLRGRREIVAAHRWLFATVPGSRMPAGVKTHREVSSLTPEVAVVIGTDGETTLPDRETSGDRASTVVLVAVHREDGWRFVHFQNTRVTPVPHLVGAP
jgi:uncharacterized protein (TIGR02246 family)